MTPFRDDPETIVPLELPLGGGERDAEALAIVQRILPEWSGVSSDDAVVSAVSGGITNVLLRLDASGQAPVLVRGYGPRTDVVICLLYTSPSPRDS